MDRPTDLNGKQLSMYKIGYKHKCYLCLVLGISNENFVPNKVSITTPITRGADLLAEDPLLTRGLNKNLEREVPLTVFKAVLQINGILRPSLLYQIFDG